MWVAPAPFLFILFQKKMCPTSLAGCLLQLKACKVNEESLWHVIKHPLANAENFQSCMLDARYPVCFFKDDWQRPQPPPKIQNTTKNHSLACYCARMWNILILILGILCTCTKALCPTCWPVAPILNQSVWLRFHCLFPRQCFFPLFSTSPELLHQLGHRSDLNQNNLTSTSGAIKYLAGRYGKEALWSF